MAIFIMGTLEEGDLEFLERYYLYVFSVLHMLFVSRKIYQEKEYCVSSCFHEF